MAGNDSRSSTLSKSEPGRISWGRIQSLYDADADLHRLRCEAEGLRCPLEVFSQLFREEDNNEDFLVTVRTIDWGGVRWEQRELSGVALRRVRVPESRAESSGEARDMATQYGIVDNREEVSRHWRDAKTWLVPPIVVSGDLLGGGAGFELLIGNTRLGNLLGLLDREEVAEAQGHLVWVGRPVAKRPV
jgi:hypothetical protein